MLKAGFIFNELEIRKPCSRLVSFFNELEIGKPCSSKTGHGHQTYTVDPCQYDSNMNIATKNTLWIYVLRTQI
jgi:hypothetical protein